MEKQALKELWRKLEKKADDSDKAAECATLAGDKNEEAYQKGMSLAFHKARDYLWELGFNPYL